MSDFIKSIMLLRAYLTRNMVQLEGVRVTIELSSRNDRCKLEAALVRDAAITSEGYRCSPMKVLGIPVDITHRGE